MGRRTNNPATLRHRVEADRPPRISKQTRLLSLEQTAEYLGRSLAAIKMLVKREKLPGVMKIDGRIQIDRPTLDAWIAQEVRKKP